MIFHVHTRNKSDLFLVIFHKTAKFPKICNFSQNLTIYIHFIIFHKPTMNSDNDDINNN